MTGARQGIFRAAVDGALPDYPHDLERWVGSSVYSLWGATLNWPDWIFRDTSLPIGKSIPPKIKVRDDLILLANFLDELGPEIILESVSGRARSHSIPSELERMQSAPDVKSLFDFYARHLCIENPHLSIELFRNSDGLCLEISADPLLGIFGEWQENALLLYFLRAAGWLRPPRLIADQGYEAKVWLRKTHTTWMTAFQHAEEVAVQSTSQSCRLIIPRHWSDFPNPTYNQSIWSGAVERIASREKQLQERSIVHRLKTTVLDVLEQERRTLRFNEIAALEGVSERTLARRLELAGISYHAIVERAQADLATSLIREKGLPIGCVAEAVGFSHSSSFARAFRQWFACTPMEWRNRY